MKEKQSFTLQLVSEAWAEYVHLLLIAFTGSLQRYYKSSLCKLSYNKDTNKNNTEFAAGSKIVAPRW